VADRFVRKVNVRIARITAESVDRGDMQAVEHGLLAGLALFALTGMVLALLFSGAGVAVVEGAAPRFGPASRGTSRSSCRRYRSWGRLGLFVQPHGEDRGRVLPDDGGRFGGTVLFRWST